MSDLKWNGGWNSDLIGLGGRIVREWRRTFGGWKYRVRPNADGGYDGVLTDPVDDVTCTFWGDTAQGVVTAMDAYVERKDGPAETPDKPVCWVLNGAVFRAKYRGFDAATDTWFRGRVAVHIDKDGDAESETIIIRASLQEAMADAEKFMKGAA